MQRDETVVRIALDVTDKPRRREWPYRLVLWLMIMSAMSIWAAAVYGVMKLLGWWW